MCWHEKSNITNTRKSPCFNNIALSLSNAVINMGGSLWSLSNSIWVTMFPGSHLPVKVTCSMAVLKTRVRPKPFKSMPVDEVRICAWVRSLIPPPQITPLQTKCTLCQLFHSLPTFSLFSQTPPFLAQPSSFARPPAAPRISSSWNAWFRWQEIVVLLTINVTLLPRRTQQMADNYQGRQSRTGGGPIYFTLPFRVGSGPGGGYWGDVQEPWERRDCVRKVANVSE